MTKETTPDETSEAPDETSEAPDETSETPDETLNPTDESPAQPHSPGFGLAFFIFVLVALAGLAWLYIHLHETHPALGEPLSVELLQAAVEARNAVEKADSDTLLRVVTATRQRLEPALEESERFAEADALAASLRALEKLAPDLVEEKPETATTEETQETEPEEETEPGDAEEAGTGATGSNEQALEAIHSWAALIVDTAGKSSPEDPFVASDSYFWRDAPRRYLEILFWALFGILVHLVVTTGRYLYKRTFWASGIYQHLALLISVPVLTFVFVTLLSLVKMEVAFFEDQGTQLDLSDPGILIAISFLVASRPWRLWNYLKSAAGRLFGAVENDAK